MSDTVDQAKFNASLQLLLQSINSENPSATYKKKIGSKFISLAKQRYEKRCREKLIKKGSHGKKTTGYPFLDEETGEVLRQYSTRCENKLGINRQYAGEEPMCSSDTENPEEMTDKELYASLESEMSRISRRRDAPVIPSDPDQRNEDPNPKRQKVCTEEEEKTVELNPSIPLPPPDLPELWAEGDKEVFLEEKLSLKGFPKREMRKKKIRSSLATRATEKEQEELRTLFDPRDTSRDTAESSKKPEIQTRLTLFANCSKSMSIEMCLRAIEDGKAEDYSEILVLASKVLKIKPLQLWEMKTRMSTFELLLFPPTFEEFKRQCFLIEEKCLKDSPTMTSLTDIFRFVYFDREILDLHTVDILETITESATLGVESGTPTVKAFLSRLPKLRREKIKTLAAITFRLMGSAKLSMLLRICGDLDALYEIMVRDETELAAEAKIVVDTLLSKYPECNTDITYEINHCVLCYQDLRSNMHNLLPILFSDDPNPAKGLKLLCEEIKVLEQAVVKDFYSM